MSFWDDFSRSVSEAAATASRKSGQFFETARLNFEIGKLHDRRSAQLREAGEACLRIRASGGELPGELTAPLDEAERLYLEIDALEKKICDIKNTVVCRRCGWALADGAAFCPGCGEKTSTGRDGDGGTHPCTACGYTLEEGMLFCPGCGGRAAKPEEASQPNNCE